jgi:hypothetical protein
MSEFRDVDVGLKMQGKRQKEKWEQKEGLK